MDEHWQLYIFSHFWACLNPLRTTVYLHVQRILDETVDSTDKVVSPRAMPVSPVQKGVMYEWKSLRTGCTAALAQDNSTLDPV